MCYINSPETKGSSPFRPTDQLRKPTHRPAESLHISKTITLIFVGFFILLNPIVLASAPTDVFVEVPKEEHCSCVAGVRNHIPELPRGDADTFIPNTTPSAGVMAIFKYSNDVSHVAYVDAVTTDGFHVQHYNKIPCEQSEEWIGWNSPYLIGFYSVDNSVDPI